MPDRVLTWESLGYELVSTGDGTPTLRLVSAEAMHHSAGAWTETEYIYGTVITRALELGARNFCSVGLGLGYNDFLVWERALKQAREDIQLISYESSEVLRSLMTALVNNQMASSPVKETYETIISRIISGNAQSPEYFLTNLSKKLEQKHWTLEGNLDRQALVIASQPQSEKKLTESFEVVLFDAFSSATSPELWTPDFLDSFIGQLNQRCVFTTYACTGNLKRSLKKQNFQIWQRPGFSGKRESILASRGWGIDLFKN